MKYSASEIKEEAARIAPRLTELRRWFHRKPELGFHEEKTSAKIKQVLSELPDICFRDTGMKTGVIAELPGTVGKKTVGLRCDIDALPIHETNTHSYVSETPGQMHACGHDGHIALLLGSAMLLQKFRPEHNVRFLFQPAEETFPSGAPEFIQNGALDGLCAVFGSHLNATSPFGKIGFCHGPVMAGGLNFTLHIHGKGGHSAYPEECHNPIFTMSRICTDLPGIRDSFHGSYPCVIVPVWSEAGSAYSQIPDRASLLIRAKYLRPQCRQIIIDRISVIVRSADALYETSTEMDYQDVFPITVNDETLGTNVVLPAADFLGYPTVPIVPSMGSDDFGYYTDHVKAYYMTFGISTGPDFAIAHTSDFDFDERILSAAAAQYAVCALMV